MSRAGMTASESRAPRWRVVLAIYRRVRGIQDRARGMVPVLELQLAAHVATEHGVHLAHELASLRALTAEPTRAIVRDLLAYRARLGHPAAVGPAGGKRRSKRWRAILAEADDE